jgi:hypothetical protein
MLNQSAKNPSWAKHNVDERLCDLTNRLFFPTAAGHELRADPQCLLAALLEARSSGRLGILIRVELSSQIASRMAIDVPP